MTAPYYQHQIICWNGDRQPAAKYQLQVMVIDASGRPQHHANWHFQTFKGLKGFLQKHFPDSDLLHQPVIQFRLVSGDRWGEDLEPISLRQQTAAPVVNMPSRVHPGRVIDSTRSDLLTVSCG